MGLSESHASVNKKRIVDGTRRFRGGQCGCMGEVVVLSYDKGIKGIFRIEIGRPYLFSVHIRFSLNQKILAVLWLLFRLFRCDKVDLAGNVRNFFHGNLEKNAVLLPYIAEELFVGDKDQKSILPQRIGFCREKPCLEGYIRQFILLFDMEQDFLPFFADKF